MQSKSVWKVTIFWAVLVLYVLGLIWLFLPLPSLLSPASGGGCLSCIQPFRSPTIVIWMQATKLYLLLLPLLIYGIINASRNKASLRLFMFPLTAVLLPILIHFAAFQYKIYQEYKPRDHQLGNGQIIPDPPQSWYKVLQKGWQEF